MKQILFYFILLQILCMMTGIGSVKQQGAQDDCLHKRQVKIYGNV
jgi:hypothetical protein